MRKPIIYKDTLTQCHNTIEIVSLISEIGALTLVQMIIITHVLHDRILNLLYTVALIINVY